MCRFLRGRSRLMCRFLRGRSRLTGRILHLRIWRVGQRITKLGVRPLQISLREAWGERVGSGSRFVAGEPNESGRLPLVRASNIGRTRYCPEFLREVRDARKAGVPIAAILIQVRDPPRRPSRATATASLHWG